MNERDLWSWKTAKSNTWLAGQCIMYHKAVIGFGTSLRSQAPDSGSRRRRDHQQERSLAEEGAGESLRLFYGARPSAIPSLRSALETSFSADMTCRATRIFT